MGTFYSGFGCVIGRYRVALFHRTFGKLRVGHYARRVQFTRLAWYVWKSDRTVAVLGGVR